MNVSQTVFCHIGTYPLRRSNANHIYRNTGRSHIARFQQAGTDNPVFRCHKRSLAQVIFISLQLCLQFGQLGFCCRHIFLTGTVDSLIQYSLCIVQISGCTLPLCFRIIRRLLADSSAASQLEHTVIVYPRIICSGTERVNLSLCCSNIFAAAAVMQLFHSGFLCRNSCLLPFNGQFQRPGVQLSQHFPLFNRIPFVLSHFVNTFTAVECQGYLTNVNIAIENQRFLYAGIMFIHTPSNTADKAQNSRSCQYLLMFRKPSHRNLP